MDGTRVLVGAMHGGCKIIKVKGMENHDDDAIKVEIVKEFHQHKSMAYGADWIISHDGKVEAAASCSFYDRTAYIWNSL
jgi:diphthamide biosynthesis protein 7